MKFTSPANAIVNRPEGGAGGPPWVITDGVLFVPDE